MRVPIAMLLAAAVAVSVPASAQDPGNNAAATTADTAAPAPDANAAVALPPADANAGAMDAVAPEDTAMANDAYAAPAPKRRQRMPWGLLGLLGLVGLLGRRRTDK